MCMSADPRPAEQPPEPPEQPDHEDGRVLVTIDAELYASLRALCRARGAEEGMTGLIDTAIHEALDKAGARRPEREYTRDRDPVAIRFL